MNTILYEIDGKLYINLTNRCTNACAFCVRNLSDAYEGYGLRLTKEPSYEDVIEQLKDKRLDVYSEVVFCGYGEPMMRADLVLELAKYIKSYGIKTRINTNGQYFYFFEKSLKLSKDDARALLCELGKVIDVMSISLNEISELGYDKLCSPQNKGTAFRDLLDFAAFCVPVFKKVVFSVVDVLGNEKLEEAKRIADKLGASLRVRELIK